MSFGKVVVVEANQALLRLQFKKTVEKKSGTSPQIQIYSELDIKNEEIHL